MGCITATSNNKDQANCLGCTRTTVKRPGSAPAAGSSHGGGRNNKYKFEALLTRDPGKAELAMDTEDEGDFEQLDGRPKSEIIIDIKT